MYSIKLKIVRDFESFIPHHQNNKYDDFAQAPSCSKVKFRVYDHKKPVNDTKYRAKLEIKVMTNE